MEQFKAVLITGSRSLAMSPEKEAWAREQLRRELENLGPGCLILQGGAVGPDTWATQNVRWATVETMLVDGMILTRHSGIPDSWESYQGKPHKSFLARDMALVQRLARLRSQGFSVLVVALEDPESPTRGTAFTLAEAAKAGLPWKHAHYPHDLKEG